MKLTYFIISVEDGDTDDWISVGQVDLPPGEVLISTVAGIGCVDTRAASAIILRINVSVDSTTGVKTGVHSTLRGLLFQRRVFYIQT